MKAVRLNALRSQLILVLIILLATGCIDLNLASTDERALENLRESGSDFSKIHPFSFYIYHPNQEGAESICAELAVQGFQIDAREAATGGESLCFASLEMLPTMENLARVEDLFNELTDQYGGEYDGWEAMVIP